MVGIIISENGAGNQALEKMICALIDKVPQSQIVAIADSIDHGSITSVKTLTASSDNWHEVFEQAAKEIDSGRILFLDANLKLTSNLVDCLIDSHSRASENTANYLPYQFDDDLVDLPAGGIDTLIDTIACQRSWPLLAIDVSRSLIADNSIQDCQNCVEYLGMLIAKAITANHSIQRFENNKFEEYQIASYPELRDAARARIMRMVVANCNIEELFPSYAWQEWDKESAATAYHSLAAHFIRFGDTNSALECLGLSDQLEDSPRSLALKGLIAMKQGEALTAVANMVSSLQQYEIRKKEATQHYLSFTPNDMAEINRRLNLGLKALNQRDNETAACHFAEAIFDFDRFYQEYGVTLQA